MCLSCNKIIYASFVIHLLFFPFSAYSGGQIHLNYKTIKGSFPLKTWKDLRDAGIEKQDKDYSCGSAATATILRSFYGLDVHEKDILDEVIRIGNDGTASFSDLELAVRKFTFKAIGLSANFEKLKTIKIPAIVYLRYRDTNHFSVIRGINEEGVVWLGDPSWDNRKFTEYQFKNMWETRNDEKLKGKFLLIIPQDKSLASLNKEFFHSPVINSIAIELLTLRNIE